MYIFICTGNICRSSMAEGIAKKLCKDTSITFRSMGTGARERMMADPKAVKVASEIGVDISEHRARGLILEELIGAERIFCMDRGHLNYLKSLSPVIAEKTLLLTDYPRKKLFSRDIPDPYGRSLTTFRKNRDLIARELERIIKYIGKEL